MKKRHNYSIPLTLQIGLLLMCLSILLTGYNLAKYIVEDSQTSAFIAKNFYFESDLLDGSTYTLPSGTQTLDVSLMNYADALRRSEVDISYTLTLYKDGSLVSGYPTQKVFAKNAPDGLTVENLTLSGAGTYTVEVEATGPYTKTLPATTFVVDEKDKQIEWHVEDGQGSAVCYLVISVGDYSGGISVTTPGADKVYINPNETVPTTVSAYTEYRLTYFKENIEEVYTTSDFTVNKN